MTSRDLSQNSEINGESSSNTESNLFFDTYGNFPDDVSQSNLTELPRYRSLQVAQQSFYQQDFNKSIDSGMLERPILSKDTDRGCHAVHVFAAESFSMSTPAPSSVPERPSYLLPSHIKCNFRLDQLQSIVRKCLSSLYEVSFELHESDYKVRESSWVFFTCYHHRLVVR